MTYRVGGDPEENRKHQEACKVYERTRKGKLMRSYRNMESRVKGIQWRKAHLYADKSLDISRDEFYSWSLADEMYNQLYDAWGASGYSRKLSPSVDRIDSTKGYCLDNIRWVTHSENSRLGSISKSRKRKEKYGNED